MEIILKEIQHNNNTNLIFVEIFLVKYDWKELNLYYFIGKFIWVNNIMDKKNIKKAIKTKKIRKYLKIKSNELCMKIKMNYYSN